MQQHPFFVYGTLKRGGSNFAAHLEGRTISEISAFLPNAALYNAGPYPFLVLESGGGVQGQVMEIEPSQYELVKQRLDELEGYDETASSNWYERHLLEVQSEQGPRMAWVYVASDNTRTTIIEAGAMPKIENGIWPV